MTSALDSKAHVRKILSEKRRRMTPEAREAASLVIVERLIAETAYQRAKTIFVFCSMPEEVQLQAFYRDALDHGKQLAFPVCGKGGKMEAYIPEDWEHMLPDRYGIPSPSPEKDRLLLPDGIDLIVVPMLGFDRELFRIGYGGGYYDRYLLRLREDADAIGVSYARQEMPHIPRESFDRSLPLILTELERLAGEP